MAPPVSQQQTFASTSDDWSTTMVFDQFDPSDGTLGSAVFTTGGTVDATASIENLAPVTATVNLGVSATIEANAAGMGNVASINPVAAASVTLPALQGSFTGNVDFAAPSGTILADISGSATQTAIVDPGMFGGGSPLVGTGTFDVGVSSQATATVQGNANLAVLLRGSAGASVSLQYQTVSPTPEAAYLYGAWDDSGSFATMLVSLSSWGISSWVTTVPQVAAFPIETSGWTSTATFNQFDPSLGQLAAILVSVSNAATGTFAAENLEVAPGAVSMSENSGLAVIAPGDTLIANAGTSITSGLGAFDGAMDFAGPSGTSVALGFAGETDAEPASYYSVGSGLQDPLDLQAFSGTGTIALPVSSAGTSTVTGPANLFTELTQQTGGTVTVSYVYTPATDPVMAKQSGHAAIGTFDGPTGSLAGAAPPRPVFIGAFDAGRTILAAPDQTFHIAPGVYDVTISGFSLAAGDKFDLTSLFSGVPAGDYLADMTSYLNLWGPTADARGGWDSSLFVFGNHGQATVELIRSDVTDKYALLDSNAQVLPSH